MLKQNLTKLIKKTSLTVNHEQIDKLIHYVELLDKWNKAYNLTSVRDVNDMLVKHIVDSIVVSPYLQGDNFIDVGTGPGLPGIPLAIINPTKQFDLVDSLGKRVRFLKQVQFELKLDNISPTQERIESYQGLFDGIISRAFASLSDMLNLCEHLPTSTGHFYALKGNLNKEELGELSDKFKLDQVIELEVPDLKAPRHLVILSKNKL